MLHFILLATEFFCLLNLGLEKCIGNKITKEEFLIIVYRCSTFLLKVYAKLVWFYLKDFVRTKGPYVFKLYY